MGLSCTVRVITLIMWFFTSVADPGCLSRIPDPDFYPSRILIFTHPGSQKVVVIPFFVATNFAKLNIILFLKCQTKKFGPIFKELLKFLSNKLSLSSQKYGFGIRDPGSGKNLFRIPDPGVKRHWIPDPDPQHGFLLYCC
jgi:hypothetical protein